MTAAPLPQIAEGLLLPGLLLAVQEDVSRREVRQLPPCLSPLAAWGCLVLARQRGLQGGDGSPQQAVPQSAQPHS